eukprot:5830090-Pyramimonas_sp.AAC.1
MRVRGRGVLLHRGYQRYIRRIRIVSQAILCRATGDGPPVEGRLASETSHLRRRLGGDRCGGTRATGKVFSGLSYSASSVPRCTRSSRRRAASGWTGSATTALAPSAPWSSQRRGRLGCGPGARRRSNAAPSAWASWRL